MGQKAVLLLLLIGFAIASFGCAPLKPWERDLLARPDMAWDPYPLVSALDKHIQFSKEGSLPAGGEGGGGCGCN